MKQDRHPIDFDTAGSAEMGVLALVLGLHGPLLGFLMLKSGATLVTTMAALLLPVAVVYPLLWLLWRPWSSRWPFEPLQEDAEVRTLQSLAGFNNCVRLATDRYGVHATLTRPFRWMSGEPFSIPWSEIEWQPQGSFGRITRSHKAIVGGRSLMLPGWVHEADQQQPSWGSRSA